MSDKDTSFRRGGEKFASEVKELSGQARVKGVGNFDFGSLHEIKVMVAPSSVCRAYSVELFDSIVQAMTLKTGAMDFQLNFTDWDLYVYLTILLRERINDVNKRGTLFSVKDEDVKIPHFFHLLLAHVGEVVDETRHLWLRVEVDTDELDEIDNNFDENGRLVDPFDGEFKRYRGARRQKEFVYAMSRELKLLQSLGFVNGSALPRGRTGVLDFMLFCWVENRLQHPEPNVEPGLGVIASLLNMSRDIVLLNPYISYGPEAAYRVLLQEVTLPRNIS
jgi:hypothetical protein